MENRKVGLGTVILLVVVILVIGTGLGYFIARNLNRNSISPKEKVGQAETNKNIVKATDKSENNTINSNTDTEKINYDGSKSIEVNGKIYRFSYINKYTMDGEIQDGTTTIYLNDKKLETFAYAGEFGNDNIRLTTIMGDKEYIVLSVETFKPVDSDVNIVIINQDERLLDTILVQKATIGIAVKGMSQYKINRDNIIFLDRMNEAGIETTADNLKNGGVAYKITVQNDKVNCKLFKIYTNDEVVYAGK